MEPQWSHNPGMWGVAVRAAIAPTERKTVSIKDGKDTSVKTVVSVTQKVSNCWFNQIVVGVEFY